MKGWRIGCARCGAIYDAQQARCPCGEPTVLNRLALNTAKPHPDRGFRWWPLWALVSIVLWLIFGYIVLKIDGGL